MASNTLSRTCDAGRPFSAALLDKGTFPWYKRDNGGGVKSLILLALCALADNPFLGTTPLKTRSGGDADSAKLAALVLRIAAVLLVALRTAAEHAVIARFHAGIAIGRHHCQPELQ